jgi:hypothetical protein
MEPLESIASQEDNTEKLPSRSSVISKGSKLSQSEKKVQRQDSIALNSVGAFAIAFDKENPFSSRVSLDSKRNSRRLSSGRSSGSAIKTIKEESDIKSPKRPNP